MVFSPGSIQDIVYSGISPFPTSVSGILASIVNKAIFRVENYTGDSLGLVSIPDQYQPAVTDLATANVLKLMAVQDNGVQSVSVGEMSVNNNNLKEMAMYFEEQAMEEMKSLSTSLKFYKARG